MPNILKNFLNPTSTNYVFPEADALVVDEGPKKAGGPAGRAGKGSAAPQTPVDFAKVQAEAILESARQEAEEIKQNARQSVQEEVESLRREAQAKGHQLGFAEGMANAMTEAKFQREQQAVVHTREIKAFLEDAVRARELLIEQTKKELRDLAIAIAEKIIRISLRSSGDIVLRMIEAATEKHKRCEWAHVYIAGCDARSMALTIPELTAALGHVSDRVHIIPMADDESGTCIIELPNEIIDASVSTQLDNIKTMLSNMGPDRNGG